LLFAFILNFIARMIENRGFQLLTYFFFLPFLLVMQGCGKEDFKSKPEAYFSESQQRSLLMQLVLKTAKKPEGLQSREEIEAYYNSEAQSYFWHYAHEKEGVFYFYISRPAPSLYGKRTGIGGSFISDDRMSVRTYREIFHTFKLKPAELEKKGALLFEKMVNRQDLQAFQTNGKEGQNGEWIEFPDAIHYFDTISQQWQTRLQP
jgi:hypothetical protein